MIALLILAVIALWCLVSFLLALAIAAAFPKRWWRWLAAALMFAAILLMPVVDELGGRRQFDALCTANASIQVDPATARGRTVYDAHAEFVEVDGTWVDVLALPVRFVDARTGQTVVSFREFRARGGWLAQAVGFPEGRTPLTFEGTCSPAARGKLRTLFKQLQITLIRRPQQATEK